MTTHPTNPDAPPRRQPSLWSRWPVWIGHATVAWSVAYGLLGLLWAFGGPGFPFGVERDANADASVLEHATPGPAGAVIAVLGLLGAVLALVMSHRRFQRGFGELLVFAWCVAAALVVLIPDGRLILAVIRGPMILIGRPLGLTEIGFVEYFQVFWSWPVLNQVLLTLGGMLWAAMAVTYRRRLDDACLHCGRSRTERLRWTAPQAAARWGRWAVAVAIAVPVGYAATRWAWAFDIPLGITRASLMKEAEESPGIWWAGAVLATLGMGGAVLTLGMVQKWGEVYPRWVPRLRGRPVRPRTAIIPASVVAILITSVGLTSVRRHVMEGFDIELDHWGMYLPQLFFPLWGLALGAAAVAYHLRRRGRCITCGRK